MPNVNYKDTSLATRYLQAFLQNEDDGTLRASGVYDEYTHNALVAYLELPVVEDYITVYKNLIITYPKLEDYFTIEKTLDTITLTCRLVSDVMKDYINELRSTLYEFVKSLGWYVSDFISYEDNSNIIQITIKKENRENIIPKSTISMVNQNIDKFILNMGINDSGRLVKNNSKCVCLIPCKPDHTYAIFADVSTCMIGTSSNKASNPFVGTTEIVDITSVTVGETIPDKYNPTLCYENRTVNSTANTILVVFDFDEQASTQYPNIWVLDITDYHQVDFEKYADISLETGYNLFRTNWSINTKFFDYLFGMAITEYSTDLNIEYLQDMLSNLYPGYGISTTGVWSNIMTAVIRDYQIRNGIIFSIGRLDTETESLMLRDLKENKTYKVGG